MIVIAEVAGELHRCRLLSDESMLRETSLGLSYLKAAEGPLVG